MERKNLIGSALTIWGRSGLSNQTASHRGIRLAPLLLVAVMLAAMAVLAETSNPAQTAHAHGRDDHTHIYTSPPAEYCPTYRDAPEERTYLETTMTVGAATRQSRSVTIDLPDCGETSTAITGISASKLGTAPDLTGLVADCNTLLDLKDDLTGTRSGSLNWSADTAMDSWDGITVAKTPPRVTRLELARKGLTGTIPEELANLTNLEKLALWENQLTGPIPAALGHLTMLNTLWLSNNRLSGAIPSQWGAPTGPSPLTALRELRLASNRLSGAIPPTLGSLQELRYLSLGENQLSGSIPKELGNLTNLAELVLDSNQLSGAIPSELGNLTRLTSLGLQYNQLTGLVPPELGNLTRMWSLTFHSNQLTGPIPPELGNLTMAIFLYMDNNRLSGEIPEELGNLTGIHEITLNGNPLTGPIPAELSDPAELTRLWLHDTRWTGTIPAELVARTEQNTLTMDLRINRRPVAPAVGDKDATTGEEFTYQVVFTDPDGHDLTYSAMQADDTPLPSWLKFDPATGNLSGTPPTDESISVRITAKDSPTDSSPPLSASVILTIESGPEKVTPPPTPAGGAPTISGTPRVGETLTADTTAINDEDGLTNVSYEYQWIAGGTDIDGATGSTFELTASEVGKTIRVRVTFTDDADNEESLTSVATVAVAAAATNPLTGFTVVDAVTNPQTVLGTLTDGVTLTLDDPDNGSYGIRVDIASGVQVGSVQLQLTGGKSVDHTEGIAPYSLYGDGGAGALNGESLPEGNYTLTANAYSERSLGGDLLGTLTVSFTVKGATAEVSNTAATGTPDITGMPQVDETLTADTSAIDDEDGLTNVAFEYQWIADGTDIAGATGSTYTLASSELGKTIQVKVTFTDDAGNEETLTSAATEAVAAKPAPLTASLPDSRFQSARHKGADDRPQVIVAFSMAVASFEKTTPSLSLTGATLRSVRQHQEDGLENAWIFFLDPDDNDDIVFSLVTGQSCDSGGICTDDGRRLSSAVQTTLPGPDEDSEPENPTPDDPNSPATGAPTVSGTPQVDQTLTASTSNIADADGLSNVSYGYQWLAAGTAISGATGSTYTLTANEHGDTIQVRVSFNDDKGNAESLTSVATDAVAAKPAPLTASFSNMPDSHDGSAEFTFDLTFSENFPLSYVTLRDHAFTKDAQNEDHVVAAKRKVPGSNQTWTITVEPSGTGAITITLPETTDCDDDGAICTDDGRMLSHAVTVTVPGPSQ